jgi:two-component system, OmpR family, manganese sensing sensor histidine kinase
VFKNFRFQIALWFIGLSSVVYLTFSILGGLYFYNSLSHSMDEELKVVASQIGHAIDVSGTQPTFRDWLRVVETEPARSVMSMQLFDVSGALLEHYGPVGIPKLLLDESEISDGTQTMRIRHSKLHHNGAFIGYLQLQLPTKNRFETTREFLVTMAVMAPFVLAGFGLCAYIVSGIAARPIEKLVGTLQRFVADAGHELNTPASIVQARAQSLERKLAKRGQVEDDIGIISSSAERMGFIVKNLMILAELDSQYKPAVATPVNLQEVLESVVKEFADRFEQKQIALQTGVTEPAMILAGRESLQCIVSNLLENALKYTESPGLVTLSCQVLGPEARLTVGDTGIGIPADCLPFIFDRFYRVDPSRSRASGGTGLGLSIVKALVQSLNGQVHVSSQPGKGSQFQVLLPIYKSAHCTKVAHKFPAAPLN